MTTVLGILTQLELNTSLLYQLFIIFVFYQLANIVFIQKLQSILENREEQTTKLAIKAQATLKQANDLQAKIDHELKKSQNEIFEKDKIRRENLITQLDAPLKQLETQLHQEYNNSTKALDIEVEAARLKIFEQKDELADALLGKWV